MTLAKGAWYPVGLSSGIEPGTSNGTRLFGREIVVWRDKAGKAHVWEDRCPHRGMRLSLGFVRGDHIACLYHGWRYDGSGRCRLIPAHPQLTPPETIRVSVIGSIERLGMIWARIGDEDMTPPVDGLVVPVRSITLDCPPEVALSLLSAIGGSGVDPTSWPAPGDNPALIAVMDGNDGILLGVQPLSTAGCVLHVVIAGDHGGAARRRVSAWTEDIRSRLERHTEAEGG